MSQWAEIRQMHLVDEVRKKEIARRLGLDIKTVRRAVESEQSPEHRPSPRRARRLDGRREEIVALLRLEPRLSAKRVGRLPGSRAASVRERALRGTCATDGPPRACDASRAQRGDARAAACRSMDRGCALAARPTARPPACRSSPAAARSRPPRLQRSRRGAPRALRAGSSGRARVVATGARASPRRTLPRSGAWSCHGCACPCRSVRQLSQSSRHPAELAGTGECSRTVATPHGASSACFKHEGRHDD